MPITKSFKNTIMARAKVDKEFCNAMLTEAINQLLAGNMPAGKALLRDYINAAVSFDLLSSSLNKNPKSLMRMLGPNGNPTCKSMCELFQALQKLGNLKISASCE